LAAQVLLYTVNALCQFNFYLLSYSPRGVILYAMVCGRLPFGDDSQVKKLQSRQLTFTRAVSFGKDTTYYEYNYGF